MAFYYSQVRHCKYTVQKERNVTDKSIPFISVRGIFFFCSPLLKKRFKQDKHASILMLANK